MVSPASISDHPVFCYLQQRAAVGSDEVLWVEGRRYTAGVLLADAYRLAGYLRAIGCRSGDTAIIATPVGYQLTTIIYAAMLVGLRVALIDPEMGRALYRSKVEQLEADWAFIDYRLLLLQEHPLLRFMYLVTSRRGIYLPYDSRIKSIATGKWLPLWRRIFHLRQADRWPIQPQPAAGPDQDMMVVYTSGTTATPKAVIHSAASVAASIQHIASLVKGQRIATHLPHFVLLGLAADMEVFLWSDTWSVARKITFIEEHGIHVLFGPPADYLPMITYCQEHHRSLPSCLTTVLIGSAPAHRSFLRRLKEVTLPTTDITMLYGMTELLVVTTCTVACKLSMEVEGDLLGRPVPGVEVKIAGDGEIMLRSSQLCKDYLGDRPEEYHATGDLGYLTDDGYLVMTGRKKNMIIRGNFNIYPALYEDTVKSIDGVVEAVFVGVYVEAIADEVVYLVVEGRAISTDAIMRALRAGEYSIDVEALPDHILCLCIPRKGRQRKIDYPALRSLISDKTASHKLRLQPGDFVD